MPFLLDTNVLSELRRKSADKNVLHWEKQHKSTEMWVSVLTLMEILNGTERVRRSNPDFAQKLDLWYRHKLLSVYSGRILPVTLEVCETRATFGIPRTLPPTDSLIGATAKKHQLVLATRNTKDFADLGIQLINPWEPHSD